MYTGQRKTLAKVPNDILIGLTDTGKTFVTQYYKLIVLLKKIVYENVSEIMFGRCLTFDAVYINMYIRAVASLKILK